MIKHELVLIKLHLTVTLNYELFPGNGLESLIFVFANPLSIDNLCGLTVLTIINHEWVYFILNNFI